MNAEAYTIAQLIYPMLLTATVVAGALGIVVNRDGSRRVGLVMIGCQITLLALATIAGMIGIEPTPRGHLVSMVFVNGLSAVPLLMTPPSPPYRIQRVAAGMFLASAMLNAMFAMIEQTPSIVALHWFASAAIDALMVVMIGGFCGGLVGRNVSGWLRDHARGQAGSGNIR